jgi:hypothetical protein
MQLKQLLDGEFAPLTYAIGFIEAPLRLVGDAFYKWRSSHCKKVTTSSFSSSLAEALINLPPLIVPPRKALLLQTDSQWTAYFDNGTNGGDPFPPMSYLAEHLKCRGLAVTCVPHTLKSEHKDARGTYGAVQFELFAPEPREFLNYERSISAANDGGHWVFNATGTVQPYEQTDRYAAPGISDRFTPEMLEDYCRALGIKVFDQGFYGPEAVLIRIHDGLPRSHKPLTLREAREELGLEP